MIVGRGMIAKEFCKYEEEYQDFCVFASGVSYANCTSQYEFEREFLLLKEQEKHKKKIIYFSSFHVLKETNENKKYIEHKLCMENFIINNFRDYLIIRLPNVIGEGGNKHTLFSMFYHNLIENKKMSLYKHAYRFIMDVSDVEFFTRQLMHTNMKICNMVFNNAFNVIQIADMFEKVIGKKYNKEVIEKGEGIYKIDNKSFNEFLNDIKFNYYENKYLEQVIKKYYLK